MLCNCLGRCEKLRREGGNQESWTAALAAGAPANGLQPQHLARPCIPLPCPNPSLPPALPLLSPPLCRCLVSLAAARRPGAARRPVGRGAPALLSTATFTPPLPSRCTPGQATFTPWPPPQATFRVFKDLAAARRPVAARPPVSREAPALLSTLTFIPPLPTPPSSCAGPAQRPSTTPSSAAPWPRCLCAPPSPRPLPSRACLWAAGELRAPVAPPSALLARACARICEVGRLWGPPQCIPQG